MKITIKNLPFLVIDAAAFYLALFLALGVRAGFNFNSVNFKDHFGPFSVMFFCLVIIFFVLGLYDLHNLSKLFKYIKSLLLGIGVFFLVATFYFYFQPTINVSQKTILIIFMIIFGGVDFGLREILRGYLIQSQPLSNVLLIAKGQDAEELAAYLDENRQLGYKINTWIKEYNIQKIDEAIEKNQNQVIVIPSQMESDRFFGSKIYEKILQGTNVVLFSEFYENILGKVSMDELKENWFVDKIKIKDGLYDIAKRFIDAALALAVLLITVIFWPIITMLINLSSKGPTFFIKERVGLKEKKFWLYKFRTMHNGNEENNKVKENFSEERGDEKRVFGVGKIMRKLRIDEWPQVLNILKGELSFVGPRADFVDYYQLLKEKIPYYQIRTITTPGLSGWAQIHDKFGDSVENARERLAYDIYYIKNRSFAMDLAIILKTLKTVLAFSGA